MDVAQVRGSASKIQTLETRFHRVAAPSSLACAIREKILNAQRKYDVERRRTCNVSHRRGDGCDKVFNIASEDTPSGENLGNPQALQFSDIIIPKESGNDVNKAISLHQLHFRPRKPVGLYVQILSIIRKRRRKEDHGLLNCNNFDNYGYL
jgi:hypothetical protein